MMLYDGVCWTIAFTRALKKNFLKDLKADNSCEAVICTAMKATWLGKVDVTKKIASLGNMAEEQARRRLIVLLRTGTALFGATGALCSLRRARRNGDQCYDCNRYGRNYSS